MNYFAYGANLSRRVMQRRGLQADNARRARLHGYVLAFSDVGVPLVEPGFATLEERADGEVHGVVYPLDDASMATLDAFEGMDNERLTIEVVLEEGATISAVTYRSRVRKPGLKPSRRYLGVILEGAEEHGLDDAWIERLRAEPTAYIPGLSELIGVSAGALDWLNKKTGFIDAIFH